MIFIFKNEDCQEQLYHTNWFSFLSFFMLKSQLYHLWQNGTYQDKMDYYRENEGVTFDVF